MQQNRTRTAGQTLASTDRKGVRSMMKSKCKFQIIFKIAETTKTGIPGGREDQEVAATPNVN
jgi:hypothetical protein